MSLSQALQEVLQLPRRDVGRHLNLEIAIRLILEIQNIKARQRQPRAHQIPTGSGIDQEHQRSSLPSQTGDASSILGSQSQQPVRAGTFRGNWRLGPRLRRAGPVQKEFPLPR